MGEREVSPPCVRAGFETALTKFIESAAGHLQGEIDVRRGDPVRAGIPIAEQETRRYPAVLLSRPDGRVHRRARERARAPSRPRRGGEAAGGASTGSTATSRASACDVERPARTGPVREPRSGRCSRTCSMSRPTSSCAPSACRRRSSDSSGPQCAGTSELTLVATLHGLAIASSELPLTKGLTIARPDALQGMPDGAGAADRRRRPRSSCWPSQTTRTSSPLARLRRGRAGPRGARRPAARPEAVRRRARHARRAGVGAGRRRRVEHRSRWAAADGRTGCWS